jgi:DNA-binding CsgD family transcriptional regulator
VISDQPVIRGPNTALFCQQYDYIAVMGRPDSRNLCTVDDDRAKRFDALSSGQRDCLRLVFQHYKSHDIAHKLGTTPRYVDKQLMLAKNILGAASRFDAAKQFSEWESGVESSYRVDFLPSQIPVWPLPSPLPTSKAPTNTLTWQQVAMWVGLIAIFSSVALTAAAMAIVALMLVFGGSHI